MGDALAIIAIALLVFSIGHCNREAASVRNTHKIECISACEGTENSCYKTCMEE